MLLAGIQWPYGRRRDLLPINLDARQKHSGMTTEQLHIFYLVEE
jgi:hypothetical protein